MFRLTFKSVFNFLILFALLVSLLAVTPAPVIASSATTIELEADLSLVAQSNDTQVLVNTPTVHYIGSKTKIPNHLDKNCQYKASIK